MSEPIAIEHRAEEYKPKPRHTRQGIGLCLSGGGYRAALYHLGALRRLNELGILGQVTTISSVSGGSILAAHLADRIRTWPEAGASVSDWQESVELPFHAFVKKNLRTWPVLQRVLFPWNWLRGSTAVEALARGYEKRLTHLRLPELPGRPRFVFCSTDLAFGVNWIFDSRGPNGHSRVGHYLLGYQSPLPDWPLARAVAASSCFPPVFDPLPGGVAASDLKGGRYRRPDRDGLVRHVRLSDGGVYDNHGLEPVWKDHRIVLVSDGGAVFRPKKLLGLMWRADRYTSVVERQSRSLRKRWLIDSFLDGDLEGTYWGVGTPVSDYARDFARKAGTALSFTGYSDDLVERVVSTVRTDLDAFSDAEIAALENHGYQTAEAAIATYLPALVRTPTPPQAPHPDWLDEARVSTALEDSGKRKLLGRR